MVAGVISGDLRIKFCLGHQGTRVQNPGESKLFHLRKRNKSLEEEKRKKNMELLQEEHRRTVAKTESGQNIEPYPTKTESRI